MSRNSSIELLRIISMLGVVILHYNNPEIGGGFRSVTDGSINQIYLYITESCFVGAVNLFILISAYYLSVSNKRRISKVVELILQVIVFNFAGFLGGIVLLDKPFTIERFAVNFLPVNYFVVLYITLYVLSPFINKLVDNLNRNSFGKLILLATILFSIWTIAVDYLENITNTIFEGLSTIGAYGSQYGYTIVNFILVYLIGAYIRRYGIKIEKRMLLILGLLSIALLSWMALAEHRHGLPTIATWNYNHPLVIFLPVVVLLLFLNYDFNNKCINELAKASFTCFLFHGHLIQRVHIDQYVNKSLAELVIHQVAVSVGIYFISYLVYKIYDIGSGWFIRMITPTLDKIDISLD